MLRGVTSGRRYKHFYLFLSLCLYYGVIFVCSHLPGKTVANIGFDMWDKAAHMILYFPLGILVGNFTLKFKRSMFPPVFFLVGVSLVLLLGVLDEFHQSFVPGRCATASDVVADVIGGGIGLAAALLFNYRQSKTK